MEGERPLDLPLLCFCALCCCNTSTYIWPARSPHFPLVSFIGTDKIYRLLSTCNKAATAAAVGDQDWKLAGKSGQLAFAYQEKDTILKFIGMTNKLNFFFISLKNF